MSYNYNLLFIDTGNYRIPTYIHMINVITGDYVRCVGTMDTYTEQIEMIIKFIERDRPDKIIFDKSNSHGHSFYQSFMREITFLPAVETFSVDAYGLITYKDGRRNEC